MPYTGFLRLGDVEIVNDARAVARARSNGITGVDVENAEYLQLFLGQSYTGPVSSADPWWTADPASRRFLGIIGTAFSGLETSGQSRVVAPAAADGGTPQAPVSGPREIGVSVLLVATDSIGMNYGVEWLTSVLQQRRAQPYDAALEQAQLAASRLPSRWGAPPRAGHLGPAAKFLAAEPADTLAAVTHLRQLFDVVLTDGPDVLATYALSTGGCDATPGVSPVAAEVTFTLTAAQPWLWMGIEQLGYTTLTAWPHAYGSAGNPWTTATDKPVTWRPYYVTDPVTGRQVAKPVTPRGTDRLDGGCADESGCPPHLTIPRPAADIDWCAATMPFVPRWGGLPDLHDVAGLVAPFEYAPIVVVEAGSAAMRRASFRVSRRLPGGFHDPATLLVRHELNVPYLPAGSRCVLDGRTGTAIVDCAPTGSAATIFGPPAGSDPVPASQYTPAVYGVGAAPVTWPVFRGDEDLRFTCHAEDNHCAANAKFTVFLSARQALA